MIVYSVFTMMFIFASVQTIRQKWNVSSMMTNWIAVHIVVREVFACEEIVTDRLISSASVHRVILVDNVSSIVGRFCSPSISFFHRTFFPIKNKGPFLLSFSSLCSLLSWPSRITSSLSSLFVVECVSDMASVNISFG
jgi:hypothetical protein